MTRLQAAGVRALLVLALVVAGCSGDDKKPPATTSAESVSPQLDRADVRVVRAWADALRRGDVEAASRYFALPSRASNGAGPMLLATLADVRVFNEELPCGARMIASERADDGFFIATFVLTERPGPGTCGAATDETARTAFRVKDGKITDWVRVRDLPEAPGVEA